MKRYKHILPLALGLLTLAGCEKPFDQLAQDPNRPSSAPASLILQGIENDMYNANRAPSGFNGVTNEPWDDEQRWNQFHASNYNYYATNDYAWTSTSLNYTTLKDVVRMEIEAANTGQASVNPYSALGKFFRAYFFENMTRRLGDIPMTDALKGLDNLTPKYDTQKAVYLQILSWLDSANDDLATLISQKNGNLSGDIYMGNSLTQWQKVVNTFKMRVLVSLSHKASDTDLNVPARFAAVLNNPTKYPLMSSLSDNMQYTYNTVYNQYPRNPSNFGNNATRENMADTYLGLLTKLKDPRTFVVAEPAGALVAAGGSPTAFSSFLGASSGEDLATMASKANVGGYSFQNRKRYYSTYLGEPYFIIGYPELQFNIAEGINRGWATGNAETYYQNGIKASWSFYGLTDGANTVYFSADGGYQNFNTYTVNVSYSDYYAQSGVKYAGGSTGLTQILQQKYLAFAQNSGMEAFYNQRRTGVPTFQVGPGTGNSTRIPLRWQYPATERQYNGANNSSAVTSQYGSTGDDINAKMWLLQD
ncbi:SusD-like starch-binding protein associating with outer membrane [Spirosoma oryzae]|uniref:SusD-like starch-binding protein associating with outer membrane n=1 Tax=Spirosoma oryzae TaxID=1469603 RepID=A0A2T0T2R8_9BACT|nr:SusD/RagB family nutrient-binding outer membrane lipoprotein [Spirosoma oryzae]PRY39978.1 SusD-like starch-binding protein associating with outer membrane [Spirosoma oryzae]